MKSLIHGFMIDEFDEVEYLKINGRDIYRFRVLLINGDVIPSSTNVKLRDIQLDEDGQKRLYEEYDYLKEEYQDGE